MSSAGGSPVNEVTLDVNQRVIFIENSLYNGLPNNSVVYNSVPKGVNVFALLSLQQPVEVTNLSNWKVALSDLNPIYPNLTHALEVNYTLFLFCGMWMTNDS